MNWDAPNRQEKLWRWKRDHGNYAWLEQLPRPSETEIDQWARRQLRLSGSNVQKLLNLELTRGRFTGSDQIPQSPHQTPISRSESNQSSILRVPVEAPVDQSFWLKIGKGATGLLMSELKRILAHVRD